MNPNDWKTTDEGLVHVSYRYAVRRLEDGSAELGFSDSDGRLDDEKTLVEAASVEDALAKFDAGALKSAPEWVDPHDPELVAGKPKPKKAPTYVSPAVAASRLGVSTRTVSRWLDAGLLSGYRTPTGNRKVEEASVEAVLAG